MRKPVLCVCLVALCLTLFGVPTFAQDDSMQGPPKVLMIIREDVKPGKGAAHMMNETAWTEGFKKAKYDTPGLGLVSVTGSSEMWFLTGYPSFAAMEQDGEKMDKNAALRHVNETYGPKEADLINESRTVTLRYQPEVSYKPNVNVGEYKYFSVAIARFRMGEDGAEFFKALNGAREKGSVDTHMVAYAVTSGMPAGTYITFTPIKSMSEWDTPPNEAYMAAQKEIGWSQLVAKYIQTAEFRLFAFSPKISIPSPQMVAANPEFWNPKPVMAKKSTPMGDKPMPAAKKEMKK